MRRMASEQQKTMALLLIVLSKCVINSSLSFNVSYKWSIFLQIAQHNFDREFLFGDLIKYIAENQKVLQTPDFIGNQDASFVHA